MTALAQTARLDGRDTTLAFAWTDGVPEIIHLGNALPLHEDLAALHAALKRPIPHATLDETARISLSPEFSKGFMGHPGLLAHRSKGDAEGWVGRFAFERLEQSDSTLTFHCVDKRRGLGLVLDVALDAETGIFTMQKTLKNLGEDRVYVDWLPAPAIDLPTRLTEYLSFHGRWCAEFALERLQIPVGMVKRENRRGRTSHEGFPGVYLLGSNTSQDSGPALGAHLGWSGNHRMILERLPSGETQLQMGALYFSREVAIAPGEELQSPELCLAASSNGLNAVAQAFHAHARKNIIKFPDTQRPRPVTVNTWEALYFDHEWEKMTALADQAEAIGAERFVLDDGWFKNRNNDDAGLGDWFADETKYPNGLGPLADYVTQKGMEFGLWVEPEMVNPDSDLYRAHPEWVLGLPDYPKLLGRNQYVLDLTNEEVSDYLYGCIETLLSDHPIGYLKWDMNRDLVMPANREGRAAAHEQTLALYALIDRIRAAFPMVEIESCASGGGRVDMEILKRTHRFWTSDSNDPVERARIQTGFSYFFPPEVMGAHIGPAWSHTSGRGFQAGFRGLVAGVGHLGLELNLDEDGRNDLPHFKLAVERYKRDRAIWHEGQLYRLDHIDPNLLGFVAVSQDQAEARAHVWQIDRPRDSVPTLLRIPGLAPETRYRITLEDPDQIVKKANRGNGIAITGDGFDMSGYVLSRIGLQLPVLYAQTGVGLSISALGGSA